MNFAAFPFLDHAQPRGLLAWYLIMIFSLCCVISPMRAAALARDGQRSCTALATAMQTDLSAPFASHAAREGQVNFFHVATRQPETLRNMQHLAPWSASGVEIFLPPSGSFGVMQAGAVRGSGAGILFISPIMTGKVRRLPDEGEAGKGSATMAVSVASRNQEANRV